MIKYDELIDIIEEIAPPQLTEEWDNSGVQINTGKEKISTVLITLEMNQAVIDEAGKCAADVVITHHPLIFGGLDSVDSADGQTGSYITQLIKADISVYSAHLTFDNAPRGNNWYLANLLHLKDIGRPENCSETVPFMTGTTEKKMSFDEACEFVRTSLGLPPHYVRGIGYPRSSVRKVGVCTGAGAEYLDLAIAEGCDMFITGDVKYHDAQRAKALDMCLLDAGHYGTEKIFTENFADQLEKKTKKKLNVIMSGANMDPYSII
ncbi:MAG: Nif3-like dinuclear metal center hexameric protein [Anaerovoracaceae bacterium]|jgi:dinuclear metal center YbgI/SA1388 family protein